MKNKSVNILIVSFLLIGVMSVMLIVFLGQAKEDFPKDITVSADGTTETVMSVRELKLSPTESKEYSVNLVCAASGSYLVSLDFEQENDGGMKAFVDVTVKHDDEVVYEGGLLELLDSDVIIDFESELHAKEPVVITVCYEMPYDVGNEAQGTYASFDIHLKIEKI